jgi:hypothetical protein
MPRVARGAQKSRHDPLLVQLGNDEIEAKYGRVSQPGKRQKSSRNDDEGDSEVGCMIRLRRFGADHRFKGHIRSKDIEANI